MHQQMTDEREQWEARLQKMERDVVRGNALQRILEQEKIDRDNRNSTGIGAEPEGQAQG